MSDTSSAKTEKVKSAVVKTVRRRSLLERAHLALTISGGIYVLIVALLFVPFFQSHIVFMHALKWPWFAKFSQPEQYGLAPGKTHNMYIQTSDNVTLGAWFVLADPYYQSIYPAPAADPRGPLSFTPPSTESLLESHIPEAIRQYPTIIWFHGNAATRAFHVRVSHYQAFASRLKANVLAIDYRSYGDSGGDIGRDGEDGLARDARAAWDWVMEMKKRSGTGTEQDKDLGGDVLIVGHSLGTAVAARLGAELGREKVNCRGVVLMSPFASIETLLEDYNLFGLVPLMKPISMIPGARNILKWGLLYKFNTLSIANDIRAPVMITHAENDWDIPYIHAEALWNEFLAPHLPSIPAVPSNPSEWSQAEWSVWNEKVAARKRAREELVHSQSIDKFGTMEDIEVEASDGTRRRVVWLKTYYGWHDRIGIQEGVQDVMRGVFHL